jgi:hypothetical protein
MTLVSRKKIPIAHIDSKLRTQTFALTGLTSSTWGAPFVGNVGFPGLLAAQDMGR